MEKDNNELQEVFLGIRDKITKQLAQRAKMSGISLTHIEAIKHIGKVGEITMKDLAEKLNITPPSASALVDTLIEKELIERHTKTDDRRVVCITLRPKTHKMLTCMHNEVDTILREIFSSLNNEDRNDLIRILRKCL